MIFKLSRKSIISYPFVAYVLGSYQEALLFTDKHRAAQSDARQSSLDMGADTSSNTVPENTAETSSRTAAGAAGSDAFSDTGSVMIKESIPYDPIFSRYFSGSFIIHFNTENSEISEDEEVVEEADRSDAETEKAFGGLKVWDEEIRAEFEKHFTSLMRNLEVEKLIILGYWKFDWFDVIRRSGSTRAEEWFRLVTGEESFSDGFIVNSVEEMGEIASWLVIIARECDDSPDFVLIDERQRILMTICRKGNVYVDTFSQAGYSQVKAACSEKGYVDVLGTL